MINKSDIERIEKLGGKDGLNFIAEMCGDIEEQIGRLEADPENKKLPLYGEPMFVKDNIDVKGTHTTAGSLALEDNMADEDAPVIRKLKENGAIILGKTNMTEFANFTSYEMPAGYSSRGGQVIHAADPKLSPSGSSSGSAVAVSSGAVDIAIGTDTSFSAIACAMFNGISALKPAFGHLLNQGIIPIARTFDSAAVMSRDFRDAVKVYRVLSDTAVEYTPSKLENLHIGVNITNKQAFDKDMIGFLERTVEKLRERGTKITETDQQPTDLQLLVMQHEFREQLEDYLSTSNASRKTLSEIVEYYEANPDTMMKYGDVHLREALYDAKLGTSAPKYIDAMNKREEMIQSTYEEIKDMDAVILMGPTNIMHFCGFPSVTVATPELNSDGYRRCMMIYGADEKRLIEAALAIEEMTSEK